MKVAASFTALLACAAAWAADTSFVIAEKGAPADCVIALPAAPTPSQETAASELCDHVRKMTGVELAVVRGADLQGRRVAIRSWTDKGDDAFRLSATDRELAIEGGSRGVLYGVYELLERFGGCRWYSSWHSVVPKAPRFSVPAGFRDEQKPAFSMRFPFWHDVRQNPRFAARLRVNGPHSAKPADPAFGGVPYRWGGGMGNCHTFQALCPVGKYGKSHPEYFALHNGVRDVHTSDPQLCLTNPDVLKLITEETLSRIRKDPSAGCYGVSQNDNQRYCTCDECRRVDEEEGSHAGTMIRFVNAVAEAVEKKFPSAVIETLAYQYTRRPPAKTRPRGNVFVCLCTIECDFSQPLPESRYQTNIDFVRDIEGWARISQRLYVWDYTVNFAHYLMPMVNFDALAGNIRFFRRNGVTDLFEQGVSTRNEGHHAFFAELKAYTLAKLLWNPDLDEEKLFDGFIRGYYGKGAPAIKTYFDALRSKERSWRKTKGGELAIYQTPAETPFDLAFLDWADAMHEKALSAVSGEDPVYAYNIRMSKLALDYTRFYLVYNNVDLVYPISDAAALVQATNCLRRIASALGGPRNVIFSQYHGANARMHELAAHPERLAFRGKRKSGYAEIEDAVCSIRSPEEARYVEDPLAEDGKAIECFGGKHGWCVNIFGFGNSVVKPGAKYRVRVRVRAETVPGAKGNVFWSGIYGWPPDSRARIQRTVEVDEMKGAGYEWYDLGVWKPVKGDYFWFGAGLFDRKKGEVSSVKAVFLDKFDLTEVPDAESSAGEVVMEKGPLFDFCKGGKAAFERGIDPQEHVEGMESVGRQKEGVLNARQEFSGHYLDLCATYWQLGRCEKAIANGRLVVDAAERAMSADGYIGGEPYTNRLYHFSLWNQAHVVYGLMRFAQATKDRKALELGRRAADWLLDTLGAMSPERLVDKTLVGNVGSQNLTAFYAFMLAESLTGDAKYSNFVRRTLDGLENTKMNLLSNPDCLKLQSQKGIEMINAWRGILSFAKEKNDARYGLACRKYWSSIAETQIRNTGAATNKERFLSGGNAPSILPVEMRPNENCVQCGWLRFTREIFDISGDVRCAREMDRTLYNHILGSVATDGSDFAYYQGNVGRKAFRKNAIYQCCRYRGFAIMAHLPELALADDGKRVVPLIYAPLSYRSADGRFEMKVGTAYPKNGVVDFRIRSKSARTLSLPVPGWCREWKLWVNGNAVSPKAEDGFLNVGVSGNGEMALRLELKMDFVRKTCEIEGKHYAEYAYGPLVLVRDTGFGGKLGDAIPGDVQFARQDARDEAFAKFAGVDATGRSHVLVDYAHACRRSPDTDEFEVFIPVQNDAASSVASTP